MVGATCTRLDVFYEMLAGHPPFTGASPLAVIAQRLTDPAPVPWVAGTSALAAVTPATARALLQRREDRFLDRGRAWMRARRGGGRLGPVRGHALDHTARVTGRGACRAAVRR